MDKIFVFIILDELFEELEKTEEILIVSNIIS